MSRLWKILSALLLLAAAAYVVQGKRNIVAGNPCEREPVCSLECNSNSSKEAASGKRGAAFCC